MDTICNGYIWCPEYGENYKINKTCVVVSQYLLSLHTVDNSQIVFMTLDSPLNFMEQISQLHANHQACHTKENVSPNLKSNEKTFFT